MEALQFTLSGKDAFFEKPEVNTYHYYTFGQIHKVVLLGMFGAILGYGGYAQKKWESPKKGEPAVEDYPEFYERLKDIKISIIPQNERGYIPKKIQIFNNSVGYASGEQGGNLIVKEQWLENPKWEIYLLLDGTEAEKIADYLLQNRCVYFPYLGKMIIRQTLQTQKSINRRDFNRNDRLILYVSKRNRGCSFPG